MGSSSFAPFVSVTVPVLNGERTIRDCLVSLLKMDYPAERREILVVDNGSTDTTAEIIRGYPVQYLREHRRGLSYARNRGIEASRGEILAFTDADCYASRRWLTELIQGFSEETVSAVAGEVVAYPPSTPVERYAAMRKPLWQEWTRRGRRLPWFLFGNAAVHRGVFDRVGLFDTQFAGGGCEDIDYSWRFFGAGLQVRYRPKAVVFHHHRVTQKSLFRQHVGYGRGQAVLSRKYAQELRWGWREESAAWKDLRKSAMALMRIWLLTDKKERESMRFYYPYFNFLRKLGQRVGFVRGTLALRFARIRQRNSIAGRLRIEGMS